MRGCFDHHKGIRQQLVNNGSWIQLLYGAFSHGKIARDHYQDFSIQTFAKPKRAAIQFDGPEKLAAEFYLDLQKRRENGLHFYDAPGLKFRRIANISPLQRCTVYADNPKKKLKLEPKMLKSLNPSA
jgi:hypothetical protein